ncbi:MAG: ATP-dependent helicase [Anaerolineales bacterium]
MSERALYLRAAEELRGNLGQWEAYNSQGHCVVLAGPGSGKTKTLTIKLARMLSEDVEEPRGVACITYNNECARELETRLDGLGVKPGGRVFIGTVHSFSLTQIVMPYAKSAGLALPDDFRVATRQEQQIALERAVQRTIKGGKVNLPDCNLRMGRYRRSILNRNSPQWHTEDTELKRLVEAYEQELRATGLIDFDDMPLLSVRALRENEWLPRARLAKYPVLVVDEYQDLGRALHRMVMELCFSTGIRLFAVGDVDQSIYGFTGARPELLQQVSEREDVQAVRLLFNYRSGSRIVVASEYVLGEERGYRAAEGAPKGTIFFHPCTRSYDQHARYLFSTVLSGVFSRLPNLKLGDIAVLYPAAWIGNDVSQSAQDYGFGIVRTDANSLYPRSSRLMRWLELCAMWCCGGWRSGTPRFSKLVAEGCRIFAEVITTDGHKMTFRRNLVAFLWERRDGKINLNTWLGEIHNGLLAELITASQTLDDEGATLAAFIARTAEDGDADAITLEQFAGDGEGNDRINLSTLHSAKGREFRVVVLFGMDNGRIPRNDATPGERHEARRLFYVGFTRPKEELHILYTAARPSPFVLEVQKRMELDGLE